MQEAFTIGTAVTSAATNIGSAMSELIPWLTQIIVGLFLVCGVFSLIGALMAQLLGSLKKT